MPNNNNTGRQEIMIAVTYMYIISLSYAFIHITNTLALQSRVSQTRRYINFATRVSASRRDVLRSNVAIISVGIGTTNVYSKASFANVISTPSLDVLTREPASFGESLRRSASNLPGYGPTDVFYPLNWQGTWTLRREDQITNSTTPEISTYPIRFIQSIDNDSVIADRTFNELNYWETVRKGNRTGNIVQSIQWTETNPNDLNIIFTNGVKRNVKVTKRASDRTDTTVSSSEFQRILEDQSAMDGNTVPKLASRRTLTKWKMVADNHIEGIEIVYDMNIEGDADRINLSSSLPSNEKLFQPKLISKSRFRLDR